MVFRLYDLHRNRAGLAVLDDKVYAVGGFNGSLRVRTVDVYDPSTDTWCSTCSMEARRSTLGIFVFVCNNVFSQFSERIHKLNLSFPKLLHQVIFELDHPMTLTYFLFDLNHFHLHTKNKCD